MRIEQGGVGGISDTGGGPINRHDTQDDVAEGITGGGPAIRAKDTDVAISQLHFLKRGGGGITIENDFG